MKTSLSPSLRRLIAKKLKSGRYHSADHLVREGLELLEERDNGEPHAGAKGPSSILLGFERIAGEVPEAEWQKLPADLSKKVDRQLYAARKPK